MWSKVLIVIGLLFELASFIYGANVFFFKSKKEKKDEYIDEIGKTIGQEIESREKKWFKTFGLLCIGVIIQALAEFV